MRSFLLVRDVSEFSIDPVIIETLDGIIIDVSGKRNADAMSAARQMVADARHHRVRSVFIMIAPFSDPRAANDLDEVMATAPDGVILSHAKNGADVQQLGARLAVCEAKYGIEDGKTRIIVMIGDAAASFFNMGSFAGSSRRLSGLIWSPDGVVNQLAANGASVPDSAERFADPVRLGRTLTLLAAIDAGIPAFDATALGMMDQDLLINVRTQAQHEGFAGSVTDNAAMVAKAVGN